MEFLFELIFGAAIEVAADNTVPQSARLIAAFIIFAIILGLGGLLIYVGYDMLLLNIIVGAIIAFVIGALLILGGIFVIGRLFRIKKERQAEK